MFFFVSFHVMLHRYLVERLIEDYQVDQEVNERRTSSLPNFECQSAESEVQAEVEVCCHTPFLSFSNPLLLYYRLLYRIFRMIRVLVFSSHFI
ncbi:hypothetical protein [Phaffia rhodozyma]|uniref:Uncharacterized protein n=1 Tax=Phaffia rhodozyma TaxID=264483 RepID=A0A0F7SLD8_PHARH|nr:hypothetical protein [Phaffia rhodozyma]